MKEISQLIADAKSQVAKTNDVVGVNGWMQLQSLLTRIEDGLTNSRLSGEYGTAVTNLLQFFANYVFEFYREFCRRLDSANDLDPQQRAYWQHQAVERLCNEWETFTPLLSPLKDPYTKILPALIQAAKAGVTLKHTRFIPYYGQHFELKTFDFAPDYSVVGMPIYNLNTPWDWHVIWHELAGQVVSSFSTTNNQLPTLSEATWEKWKTRYFNADANEEFDWETHIDKPGWISELIEDAFSVLLLGPVMLQTLMDVLRQHYESDDAIRDSRHPTPQLRYDIAGAILLERGFNEEALIELSLNVDYCNELRPVARQLISVLQQHQNENGEQLGYVNEAEFFTSALQIEAEELGNALLKGSSLDSPSIRVLIAGARLAARQAPNKANDIAVRVQNQIKNSYQEAGLAPLSQSGNVAFFQNLVQIPVGTFQDLLGKSFQSADLAIWSRVSHSRHNSWISFRSHGMNHSILTTTSHHA